MGSVCAMLAAVWLFINARMELDIVNGSWLLHSGQPITPNMVALPV